MRFRAPLQTKHRHFLKQHSTLVLCNGDAVGCIFCRIILTNYRLLWFKFEVKLISQSTTNHPLFFSWRNSPFWARASSLSRLHDHIQTYTTLGRTPLDEQSARHRDFYLTTHKKLISMPPAGFEPAVSESERRQTHSLDRAATGIGNKIFYIKISIHFLSLS
jgi:hypothetical protein